jgi:hypothetical protein
MNSAAKAIAWDLWSRNRLALSAVLIGLPIMLIPGREWFRVFQAMFFMFAMAILYWSFCYAEVDSRGRHAGFPSRMFVLPLRTRFLAGLPMIYGACTIVLFYVFWSQVALPMWDVRLDPASARVHLVGLVAMMWSLQAIIWSLYRFQWLRLFLLVMVVIGIGVLGLLVPGQDFRKMNEADVELTLGVIALLAFIGGIAGVARDRRGEWEGWTQRAIDAVLSALPQARARFKSAADAQLWFEWRGKALFLCLVILTVTLFPVIMFPLPAALHFDSGAAAGFYATVPLIALCMAWTLGFNLARTDYWSRGSGLSSFITARPLSSGDIVVAKLKAAALVTMTVTLLFALLAVPVFNIPHWWWSWEDHDFPSFSEWVRQNSELIRIVSHPVVVLTALFVLWTAMADSLSLGLKGRKSQFTQTILRVALVIGILILVAWLGDIPRGRRLLLDSLPWATRLIVTWKLVATALAFAQARRLYSPRQLLAVIGLWLITALLVVCTASMTWTWIPAVNRVIAFVAALLLPGSALGRAPINLDRSRHA